MNTPRIIVVLCCLCFLISCKEKKKAKNPEDKYFPVLGYLKSQVSMIDTSLYSIVRYDYVDSTRTDTSYIPREKFREAAKDFINIPDISSDELEDLYTEDRQFDSTYNRVILTYLPIKPQGLEIQREEVLIKPDGSGDKVTNIIVNQLINNRDSMVERKMLWKIDQSFQVTTIRQYSGKPEETHTYKVVWNEDQ